MMPQCTMCGAINDADARYCKQCSHNLSVSPSDKKLFNVFAKWKNAAGDTFNLLFGGDMFSSVEQVVDHMNERSMRPPYTYEMDFWVGCHVPQQPQDGHITALNWHKLTWTGEILRLEPDEGPCEIKISNLES